MTWTRPDDALVLALADVILSCVHMVSRTMKYLACIMSPHNPTSTCWLSLFGRSVPWRGVTISQFLGLFVDLGSRGRVTSHMSRQDLLGHGQHSEGKLCPTDCSIYFAHPANMHLYGRSIVGLRLCRGCSRLCTEQRYPLCPSSRPNAPLFIARLYHK